MSDTSLIIAAIGEARTQIVEAVRALKPADQSWTTNVTLGVGDGSGNLFVHGSYEAVTRVRKQCKGD